MKLANNVVRINGYKNNKRTHVDITVSMSKVEYTSGGKKYSFIAPNTNFDIDEVGFNSGLEAVTSYNYFNWCMQKRHTVKL